MPVHIHHAAPKPQLPPSVLDDLPDAADLRTLIAELQASTNATQRFRFRRLLHLHIQVMRMRPDRARAIAYIEQELERHPPLFSNPEGSH